MTITLAVKSRDAVWLAADSLAHGRYIDATDYGVPAKAIDLERSELPHRKILLLQSVPLPEPPSTRTMNAACTFAGTFDPTLLELMGQTGMFNHVGPAFAYLMALSSAERWNKKTSELVTTFMCAGFDPEGEPFASRTTWRTAQLKAIHGREWSPSFADDHFGLEINGIDDVIAWVFEASAKELLKLYRGLKKIKVDADNALFVERFTSDIKKYKELGRGWDDCSSTEVGTLVQDFIKLTAILNTASDIGPVLQGKKPRPVLTYSGAPYHAGYVRRDEGFAWWSSSADDEGAQAATTLQPLR